MKNLLKTVSIFVLCSSIFVVAKNTKKESKIKTKEESMKIEEVDYPQVNYSQIKEYAVKQEIKPAGLVGISDDQINDHWQLYAGYVKQVNTLNQELQKLAQQGQVDSLIYADRRRRYGFEYNGMILHEYYFENLKPGSSLEMAGASISGKGANKEGEKSSLSLEKRSVGQELKAGDLKKEIEKTWGSFDKWKQDFIATGKTRGIGWAILYMDPQTKNLTNHFIAEHQNGIIAGFKPILVMDVWEHAYMVDHGATERGIYIDAFLQNVNWAVVESRFKS